MTDRSRTEPRSTVNRETLRTAVEVHSSEDIASTAKAAPPTDQTLERIVLVEDDPGQAECLADELQEAFPAMVQLISTEKEFQSAFPDLLREPPALVILDVMLRWANPSPDMEPPPAKCRSLYSAGLRCLQLLKEHPETSSVPVILHTVLEREDIDDDLKSKPPHHVFFHKDSELDELIRLIRSLVPSLAKTPPAKMKWGQKVWQATEIKPSWLGFSVDLKQFFRRSRRDR